MEKLFKEIVPCDEYPLMATNGFLSGDGWFGEFVAYASNRNALTQKTVSVYSAGYTADHTIDSSSFDVSMISKIRELVLLGANKKIAAWFWDKEHSNTPAGPTQKFRLLSTKEREKQKRRIQLSQQQEGVSFSGGKVLSDLWHPRFDLLAWRERK